MTSDRRPVPVNGSVCPCRTVSLEAPGTGAVKHGHPLGMDVKSMGNLWEIDGKFHVEILGHCHDERLKPKAGIGSHYELPCSVLRKAW